MLNVFNNSPGCSKHLQDYPFHRSIVSTIQFFWVYLFIYWPPFLGVSQKTRKKNKKVSPTIEHWLGEFNPVSIFKYFKFSHSQILFTWNNKTLKIWNYKIMILKVSLLYATINYLMNSRTILKPLGTIRLKPKCLKLQRPKCNITNQRGQKRILPLTNKPSIAERSIRVALHWHRIWRERGTNTAFFSCPLTDRTSTKPN